MSQAYVRHPELAAARANRDFVLKQVCDAVSTISGAAQAAGASVMHPYESSGELAAALNDFDVRILAAFICRVYLLTYLLLATQNY